MITREKACKNIFIAIKFVVYFIRFTGYYASNKVNVFVSVTFPQTKYRGSSHVKTTINLSVGYNFARTR